jgi:outer membrane protein OmpA-like peptidoglycan-associated protein
MNYLTSQGIPPDELEAVGYGEAKPIAPNSTRRGREQNRRVEFTIVEQE